MCGIVGIASYQARGVNSWQGKLFENMLYTGALRGAHGTGLFAVDYRGSSTWAKVGGPPTQLFGTKAYDAADKFISGHDTRFLVGHNRYATKGAHTTENTHPFSEGDGKIILVHNGTLENYRHLPDSKKYDVDSALLAHAILVDGIDKTIKDLEGAWTIVYWDGRDKTLNILRNEERPLHIAYHEKEQFFAFASEEKMLSWCLDRNMYWGTEVKEVPANALLTFSLDSVEFKSRELKGKTTTKKSTGGQTANSAAFESYGTVGEIKPNLSSTVAEDKQIVPYAKSTSTGSEWGRGKTGQVQQQHLHQVHTKKDKKNKNRKQFTQVDALHGFLKGQNHIVKILDYDLVEGTKEHYSFLCYVPEAPDIEFIVNVVGEKKAEALADAPYGISGSIFTINKSTQPTAVCPHRIVLHDPVPVNHRIPERLLN